MVVTLERVGATAVLTIDNPPVNALGTAVRQALLDHVAAAEADGAVRSVVLLGAGRTFVGGADIREFDQPPAAPHLPELIAAIEAARKPWIAALHGATLGGGLELALGCHYRVAAPDVDLALPETGLGLIPGAGGTQRLPRLIGPEAAIPVIAETARLDAEAALRLGLVDQIVPGDLRAGALEFARDQAAAGLPPLARARPVEAGPGLWTAAEARIARAARGVSAPGAALAAVRYGVEHGFDAGLAYERKTFLHLRHSAESVALRYLFFAERAARRPAGLRDVAPAPLRRIGVIGAGTMGAGITVALRDAGLPVILSERDAAVLARGLDAVNSAFEAAAARGRISGAEAAERRAGVAGAVGLQAVEGCDLVIEAVYEDLAVKRAVFAELGQVCRRDAVLASNTSYIDPRRIAEGLPQPERFVGLHFFHPAQVMKLLEIIATPQTSRETLATGFALARRLGKVPVQAGICDGFIGNRILRRYRSAAEALVRGGVPVQEIDAAMRAFGFAMGPFETQDLSGLDISWMQREAARRQGAEVPTEPGDLLVQAGRKGRKTGAGWYDYPAGSRGPQPSAEAARIIAPLVAGGLELDAATIGERLLAAIVAEGRALLEEGVAATASDIDLVEVHGYGFPRAKGGPMFHSAGRIAQ